MTSQRVLELRDVSVRRGVRTILGPLNFAISEGERWVVLGPNGAGKTTAIKLLTGLMKPLRGRVAICGHDMATAPLQAKAVLGYVPDVAVFYEKLTPIEFMRFISDLFEMDRKRAAAKTDELFTKFALHEHAGNRIENLSHGTRQRLGIASALLHDPKVFIIDEPMVGLDPIHSRTVKRELKERSQAGMTVLMSTHLLNVAEELADRIGILHRGRLVELGTLAELKQRHESKGQRLEDIFLGMVEERS